MLSKNTVASFVLLSGGFFWQTSKPDRQAPRPTWLASYPIAAQAPFWGADQAHGHCLEVVHNGRAMKLVAGAGAAAKAHTLKAVLDIQVSKTDFYFFARIARSLELPACPLATGRRERSSWTVRRASLLKH